MPLAVYPIAALLMLACPLLLLAGEYAEQLNQATSAALQRCAAVRGSVARNFSAATEALAAQSYANPRIPFGVPL